MPKRVPVETGVKSNIPDDNPLISRWLSECVTDTKISDLPNILGDNENFPSYRVGQAVELLVRGKLFGVNDDLFKSIRSGFIRLELFIEHYHDGYITRENCRYNRIELRVILSASRGYLLRLEQLLKSGDLSDEVIDLTLRLTNFIELGSCDNYKYFGDHTNVTFSSDLITNVRRMVNRSVSFLGSGINVTNSNLKLDGESALCVAISGGVVDFYGEDCLVDLKCHGTLAFWQKAIMQMIVYLLLSRYTYGDKFKFGYMYNPRYDVLYKIDVSKIPVELVYAIEPHG